MGSFVKGMAYEIGGRLMGAIIDNMVKSPKSQLKWYQGAAHPRYPNVIADNSPNTWRPAEGYVWANPNDSNDWTVILKKSNRASYFMDSNSLPSNISYQVVYGGSDGVNLRSAPGSKDIIATAYKQSVIAIHGLSYKPYFVDNIPWVKVKLVGWMAKKRHDKEYPYILPVQGNLAYVAWDGGDDESDNFIALKARPNISTTRIAKVYTNTSIRISESQDNGNYEWVKAELIGWMALSNRNGTQLLSEIEQ